MQVEAVATPTDINTMAWALVRAGMPRSAMIGAVAELMLETGANFQYAWNNNPGNVKLRPDQKAAIGWDEGSRTAAYPDGGKFDWYTRVDSNSNDGRPNPYESYPALEEGLKSFVFEFKRRPYVVAAAEAFDGNALSYALHTDNANGRAPGAYIGCDGCTQAQFDAKVAEHARDLTSLIATAQAQVVAPPFYVVSRTVQYVAMGAGAAVFLSGVALFAWSRRR